MAEGTDNHGYPCPDRGVTDWHLPLNARAEKLDIDVEIRDIDNNKSSYTPKKGAKYVSTDTHAVYFGDGTTWNLAGKLGGISRDSVVVRKDENDIKYAETTEGILSSGPDSQTVIQTAIDELTTVNDGPGGEIVCRPGEYLLESTLHVRQGCGLHTPPGAVFRNNLPSGDGSPSIIFHSNTVSQRIAASAWGKNGIQFGADGEDGDIYAGTVISGMISDTDINGRTPEAIRIQDTLYADRLKAMADGHGIGVSVDTCTDSSIKNILSIHAETGLNITGSETMNFNYVEIDSATGQAIALDGAHNITLRGCIWYNADFGTDSPRRGLVAGEWTNVSDVYWCGMHLGHGGTGIDLYDIDNFKADVMMASDPNNGPASLNIDTGIDYTGANGVNVDLSVTMDKISTPISGIPVGVLNGVVYEAAGSGNQPSATAYVPGRMVENTDDNTLWWKDLTGQMRQIV